MVSLKLGVSETVVFPYAPKVRSLPALSEIPVEQF